MHPDTPWAVRARLLDRAQALGLLPRLARAFYQASRSKLSEEARARLEWTVLERAVHEAESHRAIERATR